MAAKREQRRSVAFLARIETRSATGEELHPLFFAERELLPSRQGMLSVLRPHEIHVFRSAIIAL